jgi:hypothetical protein
MLIAALVIGALTAYYFGMRPGVIAAAASGGLFVLGLVMPSKIFWTYGLVTVYTVGVLVIGPRVPAKQKNKQDFLGLARRGARGALRLVRRLRS